MQKIEDAREKGNVPKSMDTAGFVALLVGLVTLFFMLPYFGQKFIGIYQYVLALIGTELSVRTVANILGYIVFEMMLVVIPLAAIIMIAGVMGNVMQFGFLFTTEPLTPDISKIDPIKGMGRLFSLKKLVETIKIVLKVGAVFGVAFIFFLRIVSLYAT